MTEAKPHIRYTINNETLHPRHVLLSGIEATRRMLGNIGINGGLHLNVHTRSRLYTELLEDWWRRSFVNEVGGVTLLASGAQSYSPTLPEAWQRFKTRKQLMPFSERAIRLGRNVVEQRLTKPSVHGSLKPLRRIAELVGSDTFFATMYPEELPKGQTYHDWAAPYTRAAVISPDTAEKLGIETIFDFPTLVATKGINALSFSSYHGVRYSQTGQTSLPDPLEYLPDFAAAGQLRQFTVGLSHSGLLPASGKRQEADTHTLTAELLKDEPGGGLVDRLRQQLHAVLSSLPNDQPMLDVTMSGKLWKLSENEISQISANLKSLVEAG